MAGKKVSTLKSKCVVCGSSNIFIFLEIVDVPVLCNVLWSDYDYACTVSRGDICLVFCRNCCHIFNIAFQPEAMKYDGDYENSLHFSPRFQKYAVNLAKRLVDSFKLYDKDVIEIGCGKGDFLRLLCDSGRNRGVGFDPSYNRKEDGGNGNGRQGEGDIIFIRDFYSSRYADYKADFICCRHVLEHIQYPHEFLAGIYDAIRNHTRANVFFEVPNAGFTLKDLGIWDLIYEHCSYFCMRSLVHLFSTCGFEVVNCMEGFESQFLNIEAIPLRSFSSPVCKLEEDSKRMADYISKFSDRYIRTLKLWRDKLGELSSAKKRVVVWGAGSKGVSFLNFLNVKEQIEYVVDVNPFKQGKYISGTGQKIVSPQFLKTYQPEMVIAMNPIYRQEIKATLDNLNINAQLISA